MESVTDSLRREPEEDPLSIIQLTHQLAKGSPGLRARLRLEQRLLRSKDGNGLWWAYLSSENGYNIRKAVVIPVNATGAIPIQDSPS